MNIEQAFAGSSILAIGAMAWGHIKTVYARVSGIVLVRVTLDGSVAYDCAEYLMRGWNRPPPPTLQIGSQTLSLVDGPARATIPYIVRRIRGLNYRKRRFVFVDEKNYCLHLTAVRGLFDVEKFVRDAVESERDRTTLAESANTKGGRFWIHDAIGTERYGRQGKGDDAAPSQGSSRELTAAPGQNNMSFLSPAHSMALFGSFMYSAAQLKSQHDNPFSSLFLDDYVMDYIEQAREWQSLRDWYRVRKLPWRRGWLLHGPGGCGKSSLARALAEDFEYPLYRFHLSTMSDQEFMHEWADMSTPCVVLFEDFDAVFNLRESTVREKTLSFDCVLNQISGVDSQDGIFLLITTNRIEMIDPAMGVACGKGGLSSRPGRIDTVIELGLMSPANRLRMAKVTLQDWPHLWELAVTNGDGMTPVQFQETLIQMAFDHMRQDKSACN